MIDIVLNKIRVDNIGYIHLHHIIQIDHYHPPKDRYINNAR